MTLLVTGASGHLGSLVVEALLRRGVAASEVVATARDPRRLAPLAARGVEVRSLDYDDPASVAAALDGVRRLLLVSSSEVGRREAQHRTVLEEAARRGIELVAYTSILHADSSSIGLAEEHRATERIIAELGLPAVLLRNGWYLENYTAQLPAQREHGVLGAAGAGRISAAARADYAEAAAVALTADDTAGRTLELAGDGSFTMADYAATVAEVTGDDVGYADLPVSEYAAALEGAGLPGPVATMLADNDRGVAAGELHDESGTLSALIGRPTTSLRAAVEAAVRA